MSHHQRSRLTRAKIAILGGEGVGKTAFAVRYITRRFIGEYDPNREMTYNHKTNLDRDEVNLEILDTANYGSEASLEGIMKWADGFIMIYSVTDKESYQKIDYFHRVLSHARTELTLPLAAVANKTDLTHARVVTESDGQELAQKIGAPVYEMSIAESPDGVQDAMMDVLKQIKRDHIRNLVAMEKKATPLSSMKRVFKKKISRSKSDTF